MRWADAPPPPPPYPDGAPVFYVNDNLVSHIWSIQTTESITGETLDGISVNRQSDYPRGVVYSDSSVRTPSGTLLLEWIDSNSDPHSQNVNIISKPDKWVVAFSRSGSIVKLQVLFGGIGSFPIDLSFDNGVIEITHVDLGSYPFFAPESHSFIWSDAETSYVLDTSTTWPGFFMDEANLVHVDSSTSVPVILIGWVLS